MLQRNREANLKVIAGETQFSARTIAMSQIGDASPTNEKGHKLATESVR